MSTKSQTKRSSKNRLKPVDNDVISVSVDNDEPITIRPSQLRQIIEETLKDALKKIQQDEVCGGETGDEGLSRDELENLSAVQVKKLADQKAADEKVTIRVSGKSKIPTKKDNINFLLQEASPVEEASSLDKKKKSKEKPEKKTATSSEKKSEKKEAVYDSQKRIYTIGKYATDEKGGVYGWVLKSGKVRPLTKEDRLDVRKKNLYLSGGPKVTTQGGVDKYRKACEKKTDSDSSDSEESDSESLDSDLDSDSESDSESEISSDED
uniref:Uncharacterized protein n=1 Tax=Marseillevirus LCMAC101 TaxID=2506602 RepID=A0A481YSK9_9VIRU|nr:MAG: hypothetical protein LCMAC101_00530 [Marseillevirus LCMAC101]